MSESPLPTHHGADERAPQVPAESNETLRLLLERGSCRHFAARPIPPETLARVLEAGTHAATGGNLQPYSVIRVEAAETRARLAEMCGQSFMAQAPVHLLFLIDWRRLCRWAEMEGAPFAAHRAFPHFWIGFQDTVICAQTMCTAADALGLGSVYIGTVLDFLEELRPMFALPPLVVPVVLLCLGLPASRPPRKKKLGPEILVHSERYQDRPSEELRAAFDSKYEGQRVEATEERLRMLEETCRNLAGEEAARRALEKVGERGHIHAAQRLFGLHYRADRMIRWNAELLKRFEEAGFGWFSAAP